VGTGQSHHPSPSFGDQIGGGGGSPHPDGSPTVRPDIKSLQKAYQDSQAVDGLSRVFYGVPCWLAIEYLCVQEHCAASVQMSDCHQDERRSHARVISVM
jgi:hypothetical protein